MSKCPSNSEAEQNQIYFRAGLIVEAEKTEEFKKLEQEMSRAVEANEADTIDYQFYRNKTGIKCLVHETYLN